MIIPSRPLLSALSLLVTATVMLTACTGQPASRQTLRDSEFPKGSLVLPAAEMLVEEALNETTSIHGLTDSYAWEYARRDDTLGQAAPPHMTYFGIAEIRHREHLRTVNGRPRDHSWTYSRSIQRRLRP